jgi:hypothetical protein
LVISLMQIAIAAGLLAPWALLVILDRMLRRRR